MSASSEGGEGDKAESAEQEADRRTSNNAPNEPRLIGEFVRDALSWLRREPLVRLDRRGNLTFREEPGYELHIDDFSTRTGLRDWFWHFLASGKRWVTLDLLLDLVATIKGHDDRKAAKRPSQTEKRQ